MMILQGKSFLIFFSIEELCDTLYLLRGYTVLLLQRLWRVNIVLSTYHLKNIK
jgi:hypothetical protein